jgi:hypothetical protein
VVKFSDGEKAYVLGLLVAGGEFSDSKFSILFPFDQWATDPRRQNEISTHILTKMRQTFKNAYGLDIEFSLGAKNKWTLTPIGSFESVSQCITAIRDDLTNLGLPSQGIILESADLSKVRTELSDAAGIRFIAGICDVRASLTESHRHRVDTTPIVSVEVPARTKNFTFIVQLCSWMTSIGVATDQILYNHPSLQSADDPFYTNWRKGFKIRVRADSFVKKLSFAISTKGFDAQRLALSADVAKQEPCISRKAKPGYRSIHSELFSEDLPDSVRGQVFLHYHHICAALGCPYAPMGEIQSMVDKYEQYVSVFPLLSKGESKKIQDVFSQIIAEYFSSSKITNFKMSAKSVSEKFSDSAYIELKNGLSFLLAPELNGKRPRGSQSSNLKNADEVTLEVIQIDSQEIDKNAPVYISNSSNKRAIIVSSIQGKANIDALQSVVTVQGISIRVKKS